MKIYKYVFNFFLVLIMIMGIFSYLISFPFTSDYIATSKRDDITVVATVVEVDRSRNVDTGDSYFVYVSYTYNGETYRTNLGDLGKEWESKIGEQFTIRINPDKPSETLSDMGGTAIGFALSGAFLFAAIFAAFVVLRGYTVPGWLQSMIPERIQQNLARYVYIWVGLLVFGFLMGIYAICFGEKMDVTAGAVSVVAMIGAVLLVVLPKRRA